MQHLIDLFRSDAIEGGLLVDQTFQNHVVSDLDGGFRGTFAVAGLEHPEFVVLNGELDILHVLVVLLKAFSDICELCVDFRQFILHAQNLGGIANTSHNIFALGVHKVLAKHDIFASLRIAGEGNAGTGVAAHIAEDHGLDVDSSTKIIRNVFAAAIVDGALGIPGVEHGFCCQFKLLVRVLREFEAHLFVNNLLVSLGDGCPIGSGHFGVALVAFLLFEGFQRFLEMLIIDAHHHSAKHVDEPAIRIVYETFITTLSHQTFCHFIVQADIQDSVHHAGHREFSTGAAGNQQRIFGIAEFLASPFLNRFEGNKNLIPHPFWEIAGNLKSIAGFGRDGQSGGHWHTSACHIPKVGTLAAQQSADAVPITSISFSLINFIE